MPARLFISYGFVTGNCLLPWHDRQIVYKLMCSIRVPGQTWRQHSAACTEVSRLRAGKSDCCRQQPDTFEWLPPFHPTPTKKKNKKNKKQKYTQKSVRMLQRMSLIPNQRRHCVELLAESCWMFVNSISLQLVVEFCTVTSSNSPSITRLSG